MKSVLISIQPKWCELIASGKKTIEVRKTRPKIETPFKCYIYCTHGGGIKGDVLLKDGHISKVVCGMVIGEFICDDLLAIENLKSSFRVKEDEEGEGRLTHMAATASCMLFSDMKAYLGDKDGWGWGISELKIYDKPKELSEFSYWLGFISDGATDNHGHLKRPPQSWCYVEEKIENQEVSLDYWLGADLDESIDMS